MLLDTYIYSNVTYLGYLLTPKTNGSKRLRPSKIYAEFGKGYASKG